MCNPIQPLFGIEKADKRFSPLRRRSESELHLRLADFCRFLAETGNILQSATLYLHFSAAKSGRKAVQGTTRPLTIPRREDFALSSNFCPLNTFSDVTALLLRYVHVTYGKIAARQARGWGWFLSGICLSQIQLLCHVTLRSA